MSCSEPTVRFQGPVQMRFCREAVEKLDIPAEQKDAILFGNAKKILGLD